MIQVHSTLGSIFMMTLLVLFRLLSYRIYTIAQITRFHTKDDYHRPTWQHGTNNAQVDDPFRLSSVGLQYHKRGIISAEKFLEQPAYYT